MAEKFSLKSNDFHSNVSKSFGLFRHEDYLQDVTLVGDDHKQVKAQKLVLSTSSDYFREIFKNNNQTNIVLCLQGMDSVSLKHVLDYIYNGEVQLYQENIDKFLEIAQRLKLEGLMNDKQAEDLNDENIRENFSNYEHIVTPDQLKNNTVENETSFSEERPNRKRYEIDTFGNESLQLSSKNKLKLIQRFMSLLKL